MPCIVQYLEASDESDHKVEGMQGTSFNYDWTYSSLNVARNIDELHYKIYIW